MDCFHIDIMEGKSISLDSNYLICLIQIAEASDVDSMRTSYTVIALEVDLSSLSVDRRNNSCNKNGFSAPEIIQVL